MQAPVGAAFSNYFEKKGEKNFAYERDKKECSNNTNLIKDGKGQAVKVKWGKKAISEQCGMHVFFDNFYPEDSVDLHEEGIEFLQEWICCHCEVLSFPAKSVKGVIHQRCLLREDEKYPANTKEKKTQKHKFIFR